MPPIAIVSVKYDFPSFFLSFLPVGSCELSAAAALTSSPPPPSSPGEIPPPLPPVTAAVAVVP